MKNILLPLFKSCIVMVTIASINLAHATLIQFTSGLASGVAQDLENNLNTDVFAPLGAEIEFAAITGGTSALDDLGFEGSNLTVITGSGFIIRFTTALSSVRIRFGDFKDDGDRAIFAFDHAADYGRSTTEFSESANGNVITTPQSNDTFIDSDVGTVPSGNSGQFIDLIVDSGNIFSVYARTNRFLTSLVEIEFEEAQATSVPEPTLLALLSLGLAGFSFSRKKKKT